MGLGLEELREVDLAAWRPAPLLLAASVLMLLAGYFASGAIWGRVVADLGGPRLASSDAVRLFMIANLGRYVPGKVWQIAGLAALAARRGVPPPTAAGAAILGQGVALVAASLVGLVGFVGAPDALGAWRWVALALMAVGVGVVAVPAVFAPALSAWCRLTRSGPPPEGAGAHGLGWLLRYAANWALYAAAFWVLVKSFGLQAPPVQVASAFAAAYVLGYVMIFAPAGIGVREGFLVVLLAPHLGTVEAGVIAVVARLWTTLAEVVPAAAFWTAHVATLGHSAGGADE